MYLLHTRKAPVRPHPLQHATDTTTELRTSNQRLPVTKGVQEVRVVLDRLPHTSQHTISGSELKLELERAATHLGWASAGFLWARRLRICFPPAWVLTDTYFPAAGATIRPPASPPGGCARNEKPPRSA